MKESTIWIIMAVVFGAMILTGSLGGCSNPEKAVRILKQQGFTNVEITGWRPFMGDKGDYFSTGFKAKAVNGDTVTGAVTEGLFKGSTIRLD